MLTSSASGLDPDISPGKCKWHRLRQIGFPAFTDIALLRSHLCQINVWSLRSYGFRAAPLPSTRLTKR